MAFVWGWGNKPPGRRGRMGRGGGFRGGAGGASQTEGILSIVPEIRSGAMLRVQVWPESGDYLGVTAGDRGRWQGVGYEGPPLPLV